MHVKCVCKTSIIYMRIQGSKRKILVFQIVSDIVFKEMKDYFSLEKLFVLTLFGTLAK